MLEGLKTVARLKNYGLRRFMMSHKMRRVGKVIDLHRAQSVDVVKAAYNE